MKKSNPKQPSQVDLLVGARIRQARKEAGRTQQDTAEQLGMSFQQLQKYEQGKNRVSAGKLYEIAIELKKPIEWFFGDSFSLVDHEGTDEDSLMYKECITSLSSMKGSENLSVVRNFLNIVANK